MTENTELRGPRIPKENLDYVDLWKYFESRGAEVKNTMLSVVTWVIGFAAVILGFIVKELLDFRTDILLIRYPWHVIGLSLVGIGILYYADVLIRDFGKHINRNFDRADRAREGDRTVDEIWGQEPTTKTKPELPAICKRIRAIVWVFGSALVLVVLLALYAALCR